MTDKPRLLLVEDDVIFARLLRTKLSDEYDVTHVASGEECLEQLPNLDPDLVVMDVMMTGIDGYETCRRMKQDDRLRNVPVAFLSAADELEDRLAGYEAGGQDYLAKPVVIPELQRKLALLLQVESTLQDLEANASNAFKTAMMAMSSAAEIGVVMQAMRKSYTTPGLPALAKLLLWATAEFGLDCSVQIRGVSEVVSLNREGPCSPIEVSVLSKLAEHDRIVDLASRTAINFESISLIVKNMPRDDPERYGRLKDSLAFLIEGLDARVHTLDLEVVMKSQYARAVNFMEDLGRMLIDIEKRMQANRSDAGNVLHDLTSAIQDTYSRFALTQNQIDLLTSFTEGAREELAALEGRSLVVDKQIESMMEELYQIRSVMLAASAPH